MNRQQALINLLEKIKEKKQEIKNLESFLSMLDLDKDEVYFVKLYMED